MANAKTRRSLSGPFAPDLRVTSRMFAVSHDAKIVFSGGHWDNSLRLYSLTKAKTTVHIVRHTDIVTCLALDTCGSHLMSGSRDMTCMIWQVNMQAGTTTGLYKKPLHILYGHSAAVTTVAMSVELDMAVSGAKDGLINIHTVRTGMYLNTLHPPQDLGQTLRVKQVTLSDVGHVCAYCKQTRSKSAGTQKSDEKLSLHLYSINGQHLSSETVYVPIHDMVISSSHLIFGNSQGVLVIKQLFGLRTLNTTQLKVPVTCLTITSNNSHILVGLRDGKLIIVGNKRATAEPKGILSQVKT